MEKEIEETIQVCMSDVATKVIVRHLVEEGLPLMLSIKKKFLVDNEIVQNENNINLRDVYTLCCSQIKKCTIQLFKIFKLEYHHKIILHESRQCFAERLIWCIKKLKMVEKCLEKNGDANEEFSEDEINFATPMYFINWIDHIFELLTSLSNEIYRTDYENTTVLFDIWKNEVVDCISALFVSIDELLLSAMTLGKYCLPNDQHIVEARCQVVLRETKALITELIEGSPDTACKITVESLKLPIMPSNVNVLIDVLKDVMYALETNTNTALLSLLVHCFCNCVSPVDLLKNHFKSASQGSCACNSDNLKIDNCPFIKSFDLYNERLLQIGSFAVSCSSDHNRILGLRSALASVEALDPHLVPAIMLAPDGHHTNILVQSWRQEVQEIRDSVFLIVDPAAFVEKSKVMIHKILLDIIHNNTYSNDDVCSIINIGCVVYEFFNVYNSNEPDALVQGDNLKHLLKDLSKVQRECKIVSNLLCSVEEDFVYDVKAPESDTKNVTLDQLIKRLKLLYTLVNRINNLFHSKDNEEQMFENNAVCEEDFEIIKNNVTHTVCKKISNTYVKDSPRKMANNLSRSIFARANNNTRSMRHNVLSKLTKHLKTKVDNELNFSTQLDELFNTQQFDKKSQNTITDKVVDSVREKSILYNFSPYKNRSSLRRALLNRHYNMKPEESVNVYSTNPNQTLEKTSVIDTTINLEITEILDQFVDMSVALSTTKRAVNNALRHNLVKQENNEEKSFNSILKININNENNSISKHIWNIPVNADTVEICLDNTNATNVSASSLPSNVATLERISDLDLLENKLNRLKFFHRETNL